MGINELFAFFRKRCVAIHFTPQTAAPYVVCCRCGEDADRSLYGSLLEQRSKCDGYATNSPCAVSRRRGWLNRVCSVGLKRMHAHKRFLQFFGHHVF